MQKREIITDPYSIIYPEKRWFPKKQELDQTSFINLLPPLVHKIRNAVYEWRNKNYEGATETSKQLLEYWFQKEHKIVKDDQENDFQYYFAQRETIESNIRIILQDSRT